MKNPIAWSTILLRVPRPNLLGRAGSHRHPRLYIHARNPFAINQFLYIQNRKSFVINQTSHTPVGGYSGRLNHAMRLSSFVYTRSEPLYHQPIFVYTEPQALCHEQNPCMCTEGVCTPDKGREFQGNGKSQCGDSSLRSERQTLAAVRCSRGRVLRRGRG